MSMKWERKVKRTQVHERRVREAIVQLSNLTRLIGEKAFKQYLIDVAERDRDDELINRCHAIAYHFAFLLDGDKELDAVRDKLARKCKGCGKDADDLTREAERRMEDGRAYYCSNACRQRAYRLRYSSDKRPDAANVTNPDSVTVQANGHIEQS
jgi:hypothetical protein